LERSGTRNHLKLWHASVLYSDNENYSQNISMSDMESVCIELTATYTFAFASKNVPLEIDLQFSFIDSRALVRGSNGIPQL
jgi:hypothetical protein